MFKNLLPLLNDHNLTCPDTIYPIVVHFVMAIALFLLLNSRLSISCYSNPINDSYDHIYES